MNRKLGQLMKATLFALPLALPGVALAQSTSAPAGGAYDNADKQNAPMDKAPMEKAPLDKDVQPEGTTGVTPDEKTPPAGSLDTSGTAKPSDRNVGGDINKAPETTEGSSTSTTTKTKKTIKKSTSDSDKAPSNPSPSDLNR